MGRKFVFGGSYISTPDLDPDAFAFLIATGITDPTIISAINTLVVDLKNASLWVKLAVIHPLVGGTASRHLYDLKTATQIGSFDGGITHDSNGVTYNRINGYFNIGSSASSANLYNRNFTQFIKSMGIFDTWTGVFDGSNVFGVRFNSINVLQGGYNNLGTSFVEPLTFDSLLSIDIRSNIDGKIYNDGVNIKSALNTINASPTTGSIYSGALNINGSPAFYNDSNVAFISFGDSFSPTEHSTFNAIVKSFNTSLGR